jgi:hypothetical protein
MKNYLQRITLVSALALSSISNNSYADNMQRPSYKDRTPAKKQYEDINIDLEIFIPENQEENKEGDCKRKFNLQEDIRAIYHKFRIFLDRNKNPTPAGGCLEKRLK